MQVRLTLEPDTLKSRNKNKSLLPLMPCACIGALIALHLVLHPAVAHARAFGLGGTTWVSLDINPTHFASAATDTLFDTLLAAGWAPQKVCTAACCTPADTPGHPADQALESVDAISGQTAVLLIWRLSPSLHGLPLWALQEQSYGEAYASVDTIDRVTQDLLGGIALLRNATVDNGTQRPWVEMRHGTLEIDSLMESANQATCVERPTDALSSVTVLPPVLPLLEPVTDTLVWRENADRKHVALTFDACSTFTHGGEYNRAVIDTLISNEIPATLFIGGHWAETHPEELAWLAAQPLFELGNHTYSHPHMPILSKGRQRQELLWTQYLIYSLTGQLPRFFRPPYGEIDDDLIREVATLGLYTVEFDLPAGDADMHVSDARLTEWILRKASAGSIVVMHMNHPGSKTAEVLPGIAKALRAKGYIFGKISDMLTQRS